VEIFIDMQGIFWTGARGYPFRHIGQRKGQALLLAIPLICDQNNASDILCIGK